MSAMGAGSSITLALAQDKGPALNVRIVNTAGNTSMVLQQMLKDKGYFEKFGLKPEILNVSDGNKVTSSILGGDVDVCKNESPVRRRNGRWPVSLQQEA